MGKTIINKNDEIVSTNNNFSDKVVIKGTFIGDIKANKVIVSSTGVVKGNIIGRRLEVIPGGVIEGKVNIVDKTDN